MRLTYGQGGARPLAEANYEHVDKECMSDETQATGTVNPRVGRVAFSSRRGALKLTRAIVVNDFAGDIEGEGTLEYLMYYRNEQQAGFIGLEQVTGTWAGAWARSCWNTAALRERRRARDLACGGRLRDWRTGRPARRRRLLYDAEHAQSVTYTLNYAFADLG